MKKISIFCVFLFLRQFSFSQDYILNWQGDTIYCQFPDHPRKEGLKPVAKYLNGHIRVAAIFPRDSMRVLEAGQVKAYYREKHGKSFLCDGYFESVKYHWNKKDSIWYFMNLVYKGTHASLYRVWFRSTDRQPAWYFLQLPAADGGRQFHYIDRFATLRKLLSDAAIEDDLRKQFTKKGQRHYSDMIRVYDQLKAAAAIKNEGIDVPCP